MAYEFLKVQVENRVGWLEYHRPPVNAFNWEMLREVRRALDAWLHDPGVRVVVFASAVERYFTAGADIRVMQAMDQAAMREWVEFCHALVRQMREARKPLLAAEALRIGLVDFVVPPERLRAETRAYALDLAGKPAETLAAIRRCITQGIEVPFDEGLQIELEEAVRLAGTTDFREGLQAFLDKRPPRWR